MIPLSRISDSPSPFLLRALGLACCSELSVNVLVSPPLPYLSYISAETFFPLLAAVGAGAGAGGGN